MNLRVLPGKTKLLIFSILLFRMASFLSYPFLAVHLDKLGFNPIEIGLVIGIPYFFSGIGGIFAGNIADQLGQKKAMILALLLGSVSFVCLGQSESMTSFLLFNLLILISSILFEPAASSLIAASIPEELLTSAFRLRYIAINIGASIGPMIGGGFAYVGMNECFTITGVLFLLLGGAIFLIKNPVRSLKNEYSFTRLKSTLKHMSNHAAFLQLTAANLFISMTYCQMLSTLPQVLNEKFANSVELYSLLLTVNPITVVSFGFFMNKALGALTTRTLFLTGCLVLFITFIGFHFSPPSYTAYILLMILFTLGEVILMPTTSRFIVDLSPNEHRGTYLGSESCYHLGFFIGNLLGGFLLQRGFSIFLFCSLCVIIAQLLFYRSCSAHRRDKHAAETRS